MKTAEIVLDEDAVLTLWAPTCNQDCPSLDSVAISQWEEAGIPECSCGDAMSLVRVYLSAVAYRDT